MALVVTDNGEADNLGNGPSDPKIAARASSAVLRRGSVGCSFAAAACSASLAWCLFNARRVAFRPLIEATAARFEM